MGVPTIMVIAFFGGAITQLFIPLLACFYCSANYCIVLWIIFTEFLQLYKGGGRSMWPNALLFVIAYWPLVAMEVERSLYL